jgi:Tol biopolymer transport system component
MATALAAGAWACAAQPAPAASLRIEGAPERFAPGIASTAHAEIRLTLSPDGATALWFSRDRPGGPGGYDIWISRRRDGRWGDAVPVAFNSPGRDFDPAYSADGRFVYFCSDRNGGLGGDDLWRVAVEGDGFGTPEPLGAAINSAGDEFAPMPSPDGGRLLFSSDRSGGAGGHDLYVATLRAGQAPAVQSVPGALNSAANEFDASFLADGRTLVFARAMDFRSDLVRLYVAAPHNGRYDAGTALPASVNGDGDAYGPMLDWSQPGRLTFSARRGDERGQASTDMDLFLVRYRLVQDEQEP